MARRFHLTQSSNVHSGETWDEGRENLPTVWTNCLAGTLLAGGGFDPIAFAPAVVATSMFYVAGMFLNRALDRDFDSKYRPERPIHSGEVTSRNVFTIGFGLMGMGTVLLHLPSMFLGGRIHGEVVVWSLLLGLLIVYYNYRQKSDSLGPPIMALCRVMVYFIAAALASSAFQTPVLVGAALLAAYRIGLTYVAKQKNLERIRLSWPLLFLAAPFIYHLRELPILGLAGLVWVAFLGWVLFSMSFLYSRRGKDIPRTVITLIAGIPLLDALAIASIGAESGIVAAAVVGFLLTLAFQRSRT